MSVLNPAVLMTGATGYIGKHLLWQLLQQRYHVCVIVRRKKKNPRQRIADVLKYFGPFADELLDVIEGDLTKADCGIDACSLAKLALHGITTLIHAAGLTRFDEHLADEILLNNVQGMKNVYALANRLDIKHFHYLSTAFIAGDTSKPFTGTDLDVGQKFKNPYEDSKFQAETYLHEASRTHNIHVTIYRPGIVVGGHPLGENNIVSTVYTFIKALHFIRECCRRDLRRGRGVFTRCGVINDDIMFIPLRIEADPKISINLVSIEHVVDAIIKGLIQRNKNYSVVPLLGKDFSLNTLRNSISRALKIKGILFVDSNSFTDSARSVIEQKFYRTTSSYQPYLLSSPNFETNEKDNSDNINIEKTALEFIELLDSRLSTKKQGDLNRLALNTLGVSGAKDYFHLFVNGHIGESFIKRITFVDAKIRFLVNGDPVFDKIIHFKNGSIHYSYDKDFDCSFEFDSLLFNRIMNGKIALKDAFFDGKIGIKGNKEIALKFGYLFSDHFLNIDERIIEEVTGQ